MSALTSSGRSRLGRCDAPATVSSRAPPIEDATCAAMPCMSAMSSSPTITSVGQRTSPSRSLIGGSRTASSSASSALWSSYERRIISRTLAAELRVDARPAHGAARRSTAAGSPRPPPRSRLARTPPPRRPSRRAFRSDQAQPGSPGAMSTSRSTRSGRSTASSRATRPPSEAPMTTDGPSSNASASRALENGSVPIGRCPNPRRSGASTSNPAARSGASCGRHMRLSAMPACNNNAVVRIVLRIDGRNPFDTLPAAPVPHNAPACVPLDPSVPGTAGSVRSTSSRSAL